MGFVEGKVQRTYFSCFSITDSATLLTSQIILQITCLEINQTKVVKRKLMLLILGWDYLKGDQTEGCF